MTNRNIEAERERKAADIRKKCLRVNKLEADLRDAYEARDAAMIEYHGDRALGGLSYTDMHLASGRDDDERMTRGRVIQIVQGQSDYSKSQPPRKEAV